MEVQETLWEAQWPWISTFVAPLRDFSFSVPFKIYEVLKHANQSTNFCLTTLESWNFLILRDSQVLVIDICGKSCCLFSTKNCLWILSGAVDAFSVYQWSIVSYQQAFLVYCASLTHTNIKINKQKTLKMLLCQG